MAPHGMIRKLFRILKNPYFLLGIFFILFMYAWIKLQFTTHQLHYSEEAIDFLSSFPVNDYAFKYVHNPKNTCLVQAPEVLFVVPSAPRNFERRSNVRKGNVYEYAKNAQNNAKLLFFLGMPAVEDIEVKNENTTVEHKSEIEITKKRLQDEIDQYHDIVLVSFEDFYRNIRMKSVSMLKWAVFYCPNAKFVIRLDDDVSINLEKALNAIRSVHMTHNNFILGEVQKGWGPIRLKKNKYFLSIQEYPQVKLPTFALGGLWGFPMSSVKRLYQSSLRTKPIWLDDVFISGLCAKKVNIPLLSHRDFWFEH